MENHNYTVEYVAISIIEEIQQDPVLLACKRFTELHDHCDGNTLGCQEKLFNEIGPHRALPILNDAQHEVDLWLVANSIKDFPERDSVDMDVESHSEGFKFKYGRYPRWDEEEDFCDEFHFDPIFIKIRAMVRDRTGK